MKNKKSPKISIILSTFLLIINLSCESTTERSVIAHRSNEIDVFFKYNKEGQISCLIGPGNRKVNFEYNERAQLKLMKGRTYKDSFKYNRMGFITRINDNTGTTCFKRDEFGRIIEMRYPSKESVLYDYNEDGRLKSVIWRKHHHLIYQRNLLGNITKLKTPAGEFIYKYDYDRRSMQRTYPNGSWSYFEYNYHGRPVLIRHAASNNRLVAEYRYIYNGSGLVEKSIERSEGKTLTITYNYDAYGQLLKANYSDGRFYAYEYDRFGNRIKCPTDNKFECVYDSSDRLISFNGRTTQHDAMGNMVLLGDNKYVFDEKDKLVNDGNCRFSYNALGYRVTEQGKNRSQNFVHIIDDIPYVLGEYGKRKIRYVWADHQCLGQIKGKNEVLFYFEDHLGSIRHAIDYYGNIVGSAEYTPFGLPIKRIPEVRFGFAGEGQDEKGKVYLRARYYMPQIGRFISRDPVPPQLMNKLKQNTYAYAANSPLNYVDRDGESPDASSGFRNSCAYSPIVNPPVQQGKKSNSTKQVSYWNNPPPGGLYNISPHMEAQMYYNAFVDNMANTTINYFKSQNITHTIKDISSYTQFIAGKIGSYSGYSNTSISIIGFTKELRNGKISLSTYNSLITNELTGVALDLAKNTVLSNAYSAIMMLPTPIPLTNALKFDVLNERGRIRSIGETIEHGIKKGYWASPVEYAPSNLARTLTTYALNYTPNVGGVYLNKAAEVIGDLGDIEGVSFDPESNRIILIGKDKDDISLSHVRIDDLAAAFRTVFGNFATEPGVTIDPDPENPKGKKMIVRFFGGMENTHFGYILFEADRTMKSLGLGEDNITHEQIKSHVPGYYNLNDLAFSNLGGTYDKELWSRFWLVPDRVIVQVSKDKNTITFPETRIRVKTETMRWQNGRLAPAGDKIDEKAEYFAAHFTRFYDEYAKGFPVFAQLKTLANLVALAKWLKENGSQIDLDWLEKFDKFHATPKQTPSLTTYKDGIIKLGDRKTIKKISIFGGADLSVKNMYVKDKGKSSRYARKANNIISASPGVASTTFVDKDRVKKRVVALPTSQMHAGGAKIVKENELELAERTYCSFHNERGPFGHSWTFNIPALKIMNPHRGKIEYVNSEKGEVQISTFRLTTPYGLQDIFFEKHITDQQSGRTAFLPNKHVGIRALYPDDNKGEYSIEYVNGKTDVFNKEGKIIKRILSPLKVINYNRDKFGRLKSVYLKEGREIVKKVELSYDKKGLISTARGLDFKIKYYYDSKDRLIKMAKGKDINEYEYNSKHLITKVKINGKTRAEYEYDSYGRVIAQKEADKPAVQTKINNVNNNTRIVHTYGKDKEIFTYDAAGRPVEYQNSSGSKSNREYYKYGSIKEINNTNKFGDVTRVKYSPDSRCIKYINPEGAARAYLFDELGRLKQIQDDKNALVNKQYGLTNEGWSEITETEGIKIKTISGKNMKPIKHIVNSKEPEGGHISVQNEYNPNGEIKKKHVKGLMNRNVVYENGKIKKVSNGKDVINLSYNRDGKVKKVSSSDEQLSFNYDGDGNIKSLQSKSGSIKNNKMFKKGLLTERRNNSGMDDKYNYDDEGRLKSVKRRNDEHWEILRKKNNTTYIRNGVKQRELEYDDNGRLQRMSY